MTRAKEDYSFVFDAFNVLGRHEIIEKARLGCSMSNEEISAIMNSGTKEMALALDKLNSNDKNDKTLNKVEMMGVECRNKIDHT